MLDAEQLGCDKKSIKFKDVYSQNITWNHKTTYNSLISSYNTQIIVKNRENIIDETNIKANILPKL